MWQAKISKCNLGHRNSDDGSNNEEFDVRKFHGDARRLEDVGDYYYDHDDDRDDKEIDPIKFQGDSEWLNNADDDC